MQNIWTLSLEEGPELRVLGVVGDDQEDRAQLGVVKEHGVDQQVVRVDDQLSRIWAVQLGWSNCCDDEQNYQQRVGGEASVKDEYLHSIDVDNNGIKLVKLTLGYEVLFLDKLHWSLKTTKYFWSSCSQKMLNILIVFERV